MKRIRFRIGLRLVLLLMALACVLSAYLRASLDLRRESIRSELMPLYDRKRYYDQKRMHGMPMTARDLTDLVKVNAQIAEMQRKIGIEDGLN